jgi:hypothetical protein
MPTITTAVAGVVVLGLGLGILIVFVRVLADLALRNDQSIKVELGAWLLCLKVHVNPSNRGRDATPPPAQVDGAPSGASEKAS